MMLPLSRCDTCSCKFRPVPGDGPLPCNYLAIGERPGEHENKQGIPFCGPSGREQNENYFWLGGIRREDIYVTNAVKCFETGNRKPSDKEIHACSTHHLPEEIRQCDPDIIFLLGGTACSLVPDIDLDIEHGIPRYGELFGWEGVIIPMYHPAAGLHDTGKMIPLLEDWERVGKVLKGEWFQPQDEYPNPDYQLLTSADEVQDVMFDGGNSMAIDTERHGETAFSVQFSTKPGTGYMILYEDAAQQVLNRVSGDAISAFDYFRNRLNFNQSEIGSHSTIILHNAPQDLDWLDRMGIKVNKFRDTMQEAYHLGNLPQGLKALVYRQLGVRMRTFEDVVTPHSRESICNWLVDAASYSERLEYVTHKQLKTKVKEIRKPCELKRGFDRIYGHTLKGDKYNPWEKVKELFEKEGLSEGEMEFVESTRANPVLNRLIGHPGSVPILGIKNVPITEAVQYGCADADFTLRIALKLEQLRADFNQQLNVQEEDYDR